MIFSVNWPWQQGRITAKHIRPGRVVGKGCCLFCGQSEIHVVLSMGNDDELDSIDWPAAEATVGGMARIVSRLAESDRRTSPTSGGFLKNESARRSQLYAR